MAVKPGWEGRFFEDFEVGDVYRCRLGRTVTEADNIWFTLLTGNSNQIHFNEDYTKKTFPGEPFRGRMVVNGFLTLAIAAGLLVDVTSRNGFQVGMGNVTFSEPVFHGDTIYARTRVLEKAESKSKPDRGVVYVETTGYNQRNETVLTLRRRVLVPKRPAGAAKP